jgi:hypothetical protein
MLRESGAHPVVHVQKGGEKKEQQSFATQRERQVLSLLAFLVQK